MRKDATIVITDDGRDKGKTYVLTEMPAAKVEKWAFRAFLALAKAGVDVPDDIATAGVAGLAEFGLKGLSGLSFEDAEPLLDEMMTCVTMCPDRRHPEVVRALVESDIEEIATCIRLRAEVFKLHVNFSAPGGLSAQVAGMQTTEALRTMPMSRGR